MLVADCVDYETDVERNSFNVLRGFVHLHGRRAQLKLADRITRLEMEHARLLAALPAKTQEAWQRRKLEAADSEAALRWVFPDLLLNEAEFRQA